MFIYERTYDLVFSEDDNKNGQNAYTVAWWLNIKII